MSFPKAAAPLMAAAILSAQTLPKIKYPAPPMTNQTDDYHGVKVADPYRTLENADDPLTQKWVERENELTFSWLAKIPGRDAIRERLTTLWNYEKFTAFYKAGDHYFYSHNTGLQNQAVQFVTDSLNGAGRELLDPNTYRKDGTAALNGESVSWNGKLFAYAVAQAGSDWEEWRVRDIATGKDLSDLIRWCKAGAVSWAADDRGFYYSRFPEPPASQVLTVAALNQKIYFHKLGDPQSADRLVYERPDHPNWGLSPDVLEGGRYLLFYIYTGVPGRNMLSYVDLSVPGGKPVDLVPAADFGFDVLAAVDSTFYVQTTDAAPRGRVVAVDLKHPKKENWKEVVPQSAETLDNAQIADGKILLAYMKDAHSSARLVSMRGEPLSEIQMPGIGTASWSGARLHDREMFYSFMGFAIPPGVYRLDLNTGKSSLVRQSKTAFRADDFETKQVFYNSKDGTRVPMFLTYRKGIKADGRNPTLLYAYGGFDIAMTPQFDPAVAEWLQMGGIYAVANLRGGSEYGEAWHEAGMRAKKQNVFDDFIAAAEWLIANKYTSTPKLAILGEATAACWSARFSISARIFLERRCRRWE